MDTDRLYNAYINVINVMKNCVQQCCVCYAMVSLCSKLSLFQVFEAGTNVRVVAEGPGFSVTSDGQAVGAGIVGQTVRVRMDGGRFMSGTVIDSRTVRVAI